MRRRRALILAGLLAVLGLPIVAWSDIGEAHSCTVVRQDEPVTTVLSGELECPYDPATHSCVTAAPDPYFIAACVDKVQATGSAWGPTGGVAQRR